jgi:hypothetical protein
MNELELAQELKADVDVYCTKNKFQCTGINIKNETLAENFDFDKLKEIGKTMGIQICYGKEMPNNRAYYAKQTQLYGTIFAYPTGADPL